MGLREGTYELGPGNGRLLLRTSRTGLGRRAGHDLTIEATRWSGTAVVAGPADSSVRVTVPVAGLEVREGTGGVKPLTDSDRAEIQRTLRQILRADEHPDITFRSRRVAGDPDRFTVEGELTIGGRTEPATVAVEVAGGRVTGGTTVDQPRWGIKPYSAFLGALKLAAGVEVAFDITL